MSDRDQRTEQPSEQRLRKARDEGRFPVSRELTSAIQFAVFACLACGMVSTWWPELQIFFRELLALAFHTEMTRASVQTLLRDRLFPFGAVLILGGAAMTGTTLLVQFASTGFGLAGGRLSPDFSRLNPMGHLREMPRKNRTALQQAVLLLPVMLLLCWAVVSAKLNQFLRLPLLGLQNGVEVAGEAVSELIWKAAAAFLVWGAIDLFRQRRRYLGDLKMTKQETREEHKQNEGNPEVKMKIRRLRREMLRRRMMSEVPTATAVIVNPTHFAVALRYEMNGSSAPRVVAKGKNYLAQRIREKALFHQVPVIENPPLARALYKQVEVGQEIPAQLYRAVAEVLAYVFRLMNGRHPGA
jgi:flagellar biosynthetic protein FlhB